MLTKKTRIILATIVLIAFASAIVYTQSRKAKLEKNSKITIAKIEEVGASTKLGYHLEYSFHLNGSQFTGSTKEFITGSCANKFMGKYFYVKYESDDPDNNKLLVFPDELVQNGLMFEDSMRWVNDCRLNL